MEKRFTIERRRPKDGGEKTSLIIGCRFREQELGEEDEQNDVLQDAKKEFKPVQSSNLPALLSIFEKWKFPLKKYGAGRGK